MPAEKASSPYSILRFEHFVFGQQLEFFQRRQTGFDNHIAFEIKHALELLELHVKQQADARGQRFQEPDMRNRRSKVDMAHALPADLGHRDFDAAFFADDALIFHALILTAQAFVILYRAKDARAEQAITLRLERPVVDGFRLS